MKKILIFVFAALAFSQARSQCQADFTVTPAFCPNCYMFMDASTGNPVSWSWDFGDGTYSTLQFAEHTFADSGYYNVCLTIVTADSCTSTWCDSVYAPYQNPTSCEADFNIDSTTLNCGPFCWQFFDASPTDDIVSWHWDFGDGAMSAEADPVHTFPGPGNYLVCLTITTADSCMDTYCELVSPGSGSGCFAYFTYQQAWCGQNCFVFSDSSWTGGIEILSWYWDFGDGTTSTEQNPTHIFVGDSGYYNVCLTILTDGGCSDTWCTQLYANDSYCHAFFEWEDDTLMDCICINFYNQSSSTQPISFTVEYLWDFGDSTTSAEADPLHTYDSEGPWNVCLTINVYDTSHVLYCSDTWCTEVEYGAVSVSENAENVRFSIFPNPAGKTVYISLFSGRADVARMTVQNTLGQRLITKSAGLLRGENTIESDVSDLPAGLYFGTLDTEKERMVFRLVVR